MHSVVISQVFVSPVMFLMIGWSMALLFDLPAVISSSSVPHIMNWAVKFMGFLTTPMFSELSLSSGRVKVLPWNHRVCDFRLHGSSLRGCIDHPEILLPRQVSAHSSSVPVRSPPPRHVTRLLFQWGHVQVLAAAAGFSGDGGRWWRGVRRGGRRVRRGQCILTFPGGGSQSHLLHGTSWHSCNQPHHIQFWTYSLFPPPVTGSAGINVRPGRCFYNCFLLADNSLPFYTIPPAAISDSSASFGWTI